jgi:hypothetical protein
VDPRPFLEEIWEALPKGTAPESWLAALAPRLVGMDGRGLEAVGLALELGLSLRKLTEGGAAGNLPK